MPSVEKSLQVRMMVYAHMQDGGHKSVCAMERHKVVFLLEAVKDTIGCRMGHRSGETPEGGA